MCVWEPLGTWIGNVNDKYFELLKHISTHKFMNLRKKKQSCKCMIQYNKCTLNFVGESDDLSCWRVVIFGVQHVVDIIAYMPEYL